jgi:hypothetical protein
MLKARFPQNLRVITLRDARLSPSYAGADINDNVKASVCPCDSASDRVRLPVPGRGLEVVVGALHRP